MIDIKKRLIEIQDTIKDTESKYKDPQLVIITLLENGNYQIQETYCIMQTKSKSKYKTNKYITNDYKKELEKYTSNSTRVIINDLING